ncbi:MAG: A/G-specific adenine glycosylase [Thermodesulfobacteriota bacterium]
MIRFPAGKLITWFQKQKRDLPWRKKRSAYSTWISEIMLQQTQVRQVEPYFIRFMQRFPTILALALTPLHQVLKVWEGLGYYSRARNIHRSAGLICNDLQGRIPADFKTLVALPGIGPSTAGAILSLAFNRSFPVLDGNIRRILIRFFALVGDPRQTTVEKQLWTLAREILPLDRPGLFNEALMELGALLCRPHNPDCPRCPIKAKCLAFASGRQNLLPSKSPKKPIPHYEVTAAVIRQRGKILITRRPEKGLLGGLWEFPGGKKEKGESLEEGLRREIREELAIDINVGREFIRVRHAYSHFRITLHCFFCRKQKGRIVPLGVDDFRWVYTHELQNFPFPRADQKVIACLIGKETGPVK